MSAPLYLSDWNYWLYRLILDYGGSDEWIRMLDVDRAYERREIDQAAAFEMYRAIAAPLFDSLAIDKDCWEPVTKA